MDLFARVSLQNGNKGYKRISSFQVNHEDVIISPNGNTLKSADKYPYLASITRVRIMKITWEFQPFFGLQSLDFIPKMFITAKMCENG